MKKTYDWSVRLRVTVSNNQRILEMVASVHTNVHQLKIQIAKSLNLPILDTRMELYYRGGAPLKPLSTLLQNDIKTDACLTANIARTKLNEELPLEKEEKGRGKEQVTGVGLSIISYGLGVFSLLALTSEAKCEVCPYKSQYLRPSMMCHEVKVQKCFYKLEGVQFNSCGIPVEKTTGYLKCSKAKSIQDLIAKNPWHTGMTLHVKPI